MCGYFGIGFIDFMLKGKSLTDLLIHFTKLFQKKKKNKKKNNDIILNYFKSD